jgi:hypothetical protein
MARSRNKTLKIGDTFTSGSISEGTTFTLHDVIFDNEENPWAIAIDANGLPYVMEETDIDNLPQPAIIVLLPEKGRK